MIGRYDKLIELLIKRGLTLSCAESCTGGLVSKSITDISGVSAVFYGGVVSYDNLVKKNLLGVSDMTLASYGAVSSKTAVEMAMGVCRACGTRVGLSTTGIAGPSGGTPEKPVGTVYIGICIDGSTDWKLLNIDPSLSREKIREEATRLLCEFAIDKIGQST
jgi:PncC family amidohydrolase